MLRSWIVLLVAGLLVGVLAYRVFALEDRVERLARGGPTPAHGDAVVAPPERRQPGVAAAAAPAARGPAPGEAGPDAEHARRLADLERDVAALRERLNALSDEARAKADRVDLDRSASADRILGLVTQEAMRVRDRQVEFHRDRWIEMRSRALDGFAAGQGLSAQQTNELRRLLVAEVDQMVAIFKSHGADDDPEEANEEWRDMLEETDQNAKRILDPAQRAAWDQGRTYERQVFMPWLPP